MSDGMTNSEIEDVLSSIRRLVSEETRYPFRSERRAQPEPAAPTDKLMLTADFRVGLPSLGGKVAVLETALSAHGGEWEPDGSEVAPSAYLSEPLPEAAPEAPAEAASAAAELPPPDEAEPALQPVLPRLTLQAETQSGLFDEPDAAELDEEALREMIRELIREELQGALGERISRNLRKMVRAELNRALAGRDLG